MAAQQPGDKRRIKGHVGQRAAGKVQGFADRLGFGGAGKAAKVSGEVAHRALREPVIFGEGHFGPDQALKGFGVVPVRRSWRARAPPRPARRGRLGEKELLIVPSQGQAQMRVEPGEGFGEL